MGRPKPPQKYRHTFNCQLKLTDQTEDHLDDVSLMEGLEGIIQEAIEKNIGGWNPQIHVIWEQSEQC